jgi:endothelin-converting enzyme/putative endopeptidase
VNHKLPLAEAEALAPRLRLKEYLAAAGAPPVAAVNVTEPAFFREVDRLLGAEPLPRWKAYLRWHLVRARAPYLSSRFVREDFAFEQRTLLGVEALKPRWKRCVEWVDRDLGEALGQVFVERAFPPEVKEATLAMARRVEEAMGVRLRALDWLEPATKAAALEKLQALGNKVGYPDRWRDYGALEIVRGDLAGNVARAARFETARQLAKIGKPVDRGEWLMTPATVNAYYNPLMNDMNFPAAVLLPPLFDPRMDLAPGYGNTGATIGHELVHAFDDEGRQYDARGNLRDWWTEGDAGRFEERAACTVEQYARYPVVDEIRINSRLTLGEDLADLAGTTLAWEAWRAATRGETLEPRDGLTPEQRFFVGFAQWACANERPEALRVRAATNPHSPPRWRIDGVVANMPEFREAFGCKAGQALARERVCRVW